jgi:hypothetical protein
MYLWLMVFLTLAAVSGGTGGKASLCGLVAANKDVPYRFKCHCWLYVNYEWVPLLTTVSFQRSTFDHETGSLVDGTTTNTEIATDGEGWATYEFTTHLERADTGDRDFIQGVRVRASVELEGETFGDSLRTVPLLWIDPRDTIEKVLTVKVEPQQGLQRQ